MDIRPSSSTRGGWKQFIQHVDYLTSIRFGWYQGSPLRNYNDVVAGAFLKLATSPDPPNIDGVWCQKDRKVDLKHLDRDWFFYLVRLFRDTCILLYTIVYYCILVTCLYTIKTNGGEENNNRLQSSNIPIPSGQLHWALDETPNAWALNQVPQPCGLAIASIFESDVGNIPSSRRYPARIHLQSCCFGY